jgi:hypothetical protein
MTVAGVMERFVEEASASLARLDSIRRIAPPNRSGA